MAFAFALDPAIPAGTEAAALGDDRIREFKNAMIERVNSRFVSVDADPWIIKSPAAGAGNTQSIVPTADNTYELGRSTHRYAHAYAVQASMNQLNTLAVRMLAATTLEIQNNVGTVLGTWSHASGALTQNYLLDTKSSVYVATTQRLYFDGGGDTYIHEQAANLLNFTVGASTKILIGANVLVQNADFGVSPTRRIYLDDGSDTYIYEVGPNLLRVIAGTSPVVDFGVAELWVYQDIKLTALKRLYLDGGSNTYIHESAADVITVVAGGVGNTGFTPTQVNLGVAIDLVLQPAKRIYLDGGGNTYISEDIADEIAFVAAGVTRLRVRGSGIGHQVIISGSATIPAGERIFLDGGDDTYIYEGALNQIHLVAAGAERFRAQAGAIVIPATALFYLDGGNNTYIHESAADQFDLVVGGTTTLRSSATLITAFANFAVAAAQRLYLDSGVDTYIVESAANQIDVYTGGIHRIRIGGSVLVVSGTSLQVAAAERFYLDGGGDTYIYESAANSVSIIAGGGSRMTWNATHVSVPALIKFYYDGGGDTYIHEQAANTLEVVAGGSAGTRFIAPAAAGLLGIQFWNVDGAAWVRVKISTDLDVSGNNILTVV